MKKLIVLLSLVLVLPGCFTISSWRGYSKWAGKTEELSSNNVILTRAVTERGRSYRKFLLEFKSLDTEISKVYVLDLRADRGFYLLHNSSSIETNGNLTTIRITPDLEICEIEGETPINIQQPAFRLVDNLVEYKSPSDSDFRLVATTPYITWTTGELTTGEIITGSLLGVATPAIVAFDITIGCGLWVGLKAMDILD